jgi:hypothetical protein
MRRVRWLEQQRCLWRCDVQDLSASAFTRHPSLASPSCLAPLPAQGSLYTSWTPSPALVALWPRTLLSVPPSPLRLSPFSPRIASARAALVLQMRCTPGFKRVWLSSSMRTRYGQLTPERRVSRRMGAKGSNSVGVLQAVLPRLAPRHSQTQRPSASGAALRRAGRGPSVRPNEAGDAGRSGREERRVDA